MSGNLRDSLLPPGAPNPIVWCERCGREHRLHTFTRDDFDAMLADQAKLMADAIDAQILAAIFK